MSRVTITRTEQGDYSLAAGPFVLEIDAKTYQDFAVLAEGMARLRFNLASGVDGGRDFAAWASELPEPKQCVLRVFFDLAADRMQDISAAAMAQKPRRICG